ncbi:YgiQ family radical SAM protein [bacterium]|nr:YgiQ family radical SAM protein [bacterium]
MKNTFLPISKEDLKERLWDQLDIIIISGDAYVDHPAFGTAVIGRVLEAEGYKVGIIAQPDWNSDKDFMELGRPKLFLAITAGNIDSMLAHYTANKKLRHNDEYSPGDKHGLRPNRAVIVYTNKIRQIYKQEVPVIIGGLEASLRRLAHYDYWSDSVRKSILFDSKADLLVYGMAEKSIIEIADLLKSGKNIKDITSVRGTCYISNELPRDAVLMPGFEQVSKDKNAFIDAQLLIEKYSCSDKKLVQGCMDRYLAQNPMQNPLMQSELDKVYSLPFTRKAHPCYEKQGGVPALETVKFSITSHRGCFGGCSFCSIGIHQGKIIQSRSHESIIKEVEKISNMPDFKGHITDIGGPTANMYNAVCKAPCDTKKCLLNGKLCKNLQLDHDDYLKLLSEIKSLPKVKHVSISSGLRHDLILYENHSDVIIEEICRNYVSGKIKLAPEHSEKHVLSLMNKPAFEVFKKFLSIYKKINEKLGKKQFVESYLISSHPGCTMKDMKNLINELKKLGLSPKQAQDFIPNPMTMSTCMYYTEMNPFTREKIYAAKTAKEKLEQRGLL